MEMEKKTQVFFFHGQSVVFLRYSLHMCIYIHTYVYNCVYIYTSYIYHIYITFIYHMHLSYVGVDVYPYVKSKACSLVVSDFVGAFWLYQHGFLENGHP